MIEHVFVLMLENRSFDHMLGLAGIRGIDAATGEQRAVDGLVGNEFNRLPSGAEIAVGKGADWIMGADPGHEFTHVLEQLCGVGTAYTPGSAYPPINNSGFAASFAAQDPGRNPATVMQCFRPEQVPVLVALATSFGVCDRWFSSLPGPTWPNRLFLHAASSSGLDSSPVGIEHLSAVLAGYKFRNGTIYDRLNSAGLKWHIVEGDELPQSLTVAGLIDSALQDHFWDMQEFSAALSTPGFTDHYIFIEPNYGHVLYDGSNFKCGNSQHPLDDVTRGEKLIKDVYEMIRRSPYWEQSALIITYDEHGGFFDHVPPPAAAPPGDNPSPDYGHFGFDFSRLGVRVPAVVVSPYTPAGLVDHQVHDHSSVPATLEALFSLEPLTDRDRGAAPLTAMFPLAAARPDAPLTLPDPANSGLPDCEGSLGEKLAASLTSPGNLAGRVDDALVGFLHVAIARQLHMAAKKTGDLESAVAAEGDRLLSTFGAITNKLEAAKFIEQTRQEYQAHKSSGSQ
jgi:phospholipase C